MYTILSVVSKFIVETFMKQELYILPHSLGLGVDKKKSAFQISNSLENLNEVLHRESNTLDGKSIFQQVTELRDIKQQKLISNYDHYTLTSCLEKNIHTHYLFGCHRVSKSSLFPGL